MINSPAITVLMSVYNGEKYLHEAIDSILNQTYCDFEFVIYDDCSTDSSANIIASYKDSRIVFRQNETNRGLTQNLMEGVEMARGEYIARMDADDIAMPQRLEKQVSWMEAHPDITILGSRVMYFNDEGNICVTTDPIDDDTIKATLFVSFTMLHPTIMIRKAVLVDKGLNYNPSFRYSQDHALYFDCILNHCKFANYPEPLLKMRSHEGSISKAKHGPQQECSSYARNMFLKSIGLLGKVGEGELLAYNLIASGVFLSTVQDINYLASFADKILKTREIGDYIDREVLHCVFTDRVWNLAYGVATLPKYLEATGAMGLLSNIGIKSCWSVKLHLKFIIKRMLAVVRSLL